MSFRRWIKLKNYNVGVKAFVLLLTFSVVAACVSKRPAVNRIEGKEIPVTGVNGSDAALEALIKPYHDHVEAEMGSVLSYAPQTLDKTGKWQTPIGSLFADATLEKADAVFKKRENKNVDFCMLNSGGVRSIIPQGNVTMRTAFEIMPFENSVVVVEMADAQIREMLAYIISERKPHPLSGITFSISADGKPANILIRGQVYDPNRTYFVATNDYLYNGGDSMLFFKKGGKKYDLDYKLRNVLIDYFSENDTLHAPKNDRIFPQP